MDKAEPSRYGGSGTLYERRCMPLPRERAVHVLDSDTLPVPTGAPLPRQVQVAGKSCKFALHAETWQALDEICAREGMSQGELLTELVERSGRASLKRALEVFVVAYFRQAATAGSMR